MRRLATTLALVGTLLVAAAAARPEDGNSGSASCVPDLTVGLDTSYSFTTDDYVLIDGNFDNFTTCGERARLLWNVDGNEERGRYFYASPGTFTTEGAFPGSLQIFFNESETASNEYYFTVTIVNGSSGASSSGSRDTCTPDGTILVEPSYVFGSEDYVVINADYSFFRNCDDESHVQWQLLRDGNIVFNSSDWSLYAYPSELPPGDYNGFVQSFIGADSTVPMGEAQFNLTIVNGSTPTDAPASNSGSHGYDCVADPAVLLESSYTFFTSGEIYLYGDYSYFSSCNEPTTLVWTLDSSNQTGWYFYADAAAYPEGLNNGTLQVFLNDTLYNEYYFSVYIVNGTYPTDEPVAPPAPTECVPSYTIFTSETYWFELSQEIYIYPDLDYLNTCGAPYDFEWRIGSLSQNGTYFDAAAGSLAEGTYAATLVLTVGDNISAVNDFNVTIYNGSDSAVSLMAVKKTASVIYSHHRRIATHVAAKPRHSRVHVDLRKCAASLNFELPLEMAVAGTHTNVIVPGTRLVRGCGAHPSLVWKVGTAFGTGKQFRMKADAFAPGAYVGQMYVMVQRQPVATHTFLLHVDAAKKMTYTYRPLKALTSQRSTTTGAAGSTKKASPPKAVPLGVYLALGTGLVALVAIAAAVVTLRKQGSKTERQPLVIQA